MRLDEITKPSIEQTVEFIKSAHAGQVDKSGNPYWRHPVSVMKRVQNPTENEQHAALMHDIIEDTSYTADNLREMGYQEDVIQMVILLTKKNDGKTYLEKIQALADSGNRGAIKIKIADNEDNSDPDRIALLPPEQQGIAKRYQKSLNILRKVV